jgi:hypothetical protein
MKVWFELSKSNKVSAWCRANVTAFNQRSDTLCIWFYFQMKKRKKKYLITHPPNLWFEYKFHKGKIGVFPFACKNIVSVWLAKMFGYIIATKTFLSFPNFVIYP